MEPGLYRGSLMRKGGFLTFLTDLVADPAKYAASSVGGHFAGSGEKRTKFG